MIISSKCNGAASSRGAAYSLLEMLITVAMLGTLLAIVLPYAMNINQEFEDSKNRRNAQSLASVSVMASAAGLDFVEGDDLDKSIRNIVQGGEVPSGPLQGKVYKVVMGEKEIQDAKKYLHIESGQLSYSRVARTP